MAPGYASRIISRLGEAGRINGGRVKPSFYNDGLLAAASREHGYMIVTHDRQDFELIALVAPAVYPEQQRMLAYVLLRQGTML
jgi:predicted nucleic acid-binding protein